MWPDRNEALSRLISSERAIEDLYAEALREWAPTLRAVVLPSLTAAANDSADSTLPPDPDATTQAQPGWDKLTDDLILAGVAVLFAATIYETAQALGVELPGIKGGKKTLPAKNIQRAAKIVADASGVDLDEILLAHQIIEDDAALKAARDEFVESQRDEVSRTPAHVQRKIEAAVRDVTVEPGTSTSAQLAAQRSAVADAIASDSPAMRDVARVAGYQAAAVQNSAVIHAAGQSDDEREKTWIATIDGKTRPTHFAADGQRTPLASTFTVGGEQLAYPGDPAGTPSEVANCRCRVGVLAPDEALPSELDRHTERLNGRDSVQINREGTQQDEIDRRADEGTVRAREDPEGIGRTASAAPSEVEQDMTGTVTTLADADADGDTDASGDADTYRTFSDAVVAILGTPTSDGRMLASNIDLTFRSMPLPLMWTKQNGLGHIDAYTVGVIESASVDGSNVVASGYMLNSPEADEAADQIGHGVTGPSVDLAAAEWMLTDDKGNELEGDWWDIPDDVQVYQTITVAELIGTTLVATPAFGDTKLTLNPDRESRSPALVASAAEEFRPKVYDYRLFEDPKLSGPTLPTMGEDGRIYGHLACFGECHRSIQSQCIIAPRSASNYSHFHTSPAVRLSDGRRLPVGRLTVGTGHANDKMAAGPAMAHYDNTGTCFALVRVGEDQHGIWFSGVAAPGATVEQIEAGITSPLSGDWRDFGAGLELIAALAVNTPGFAARGRDDDQGRPIALVASIGPAPDTDRGGAHNLTLADIKSAVREAVEESHRQHALAVERDALLARAAEITTPPEPLSPNDAVGQLLAEAGI